MKKKNFFVALLLFLSLASASVFGITMGMEHDSGQMQMVGCMFMSGPDAMCPMTISEHINKWRDTFLATVSNNVLLVFGLALVAVVVIKTFSSGIQISLSYFYYRRDHPNISLFLPLRYAFARGILHPRIYA